MQFYNIIIKYRFWLSLLLLVLGLGLNFTGTGFWPTFPIYLVFVIGILSHFFIGPLRLIQEPMEQGNVEEVEKNIKVCLVSGITIQACTFYVLYHQRKFSDDVARF